MPVAPFLCYTGGRFGFPDTSSQPAIDAVSWKNPREYEFSMKHVRMAAVSVVVSFALAACTQSPLSPSQPSAALSTTVAAANADGSTLKVGAPVPFTPTADERTDSRRPPLVWGNASGVYAQEGLAYHIQVYDGSTLVYEAIVGETPNTGSHTLPFDLSYDKQYSWRIRAVLGSDAGPWSASQTFKTPLAPVVVTTPTPTTPTTPTTGTIGPARTIEIAEAFNMIVRIHDGGRFNLGRSSSRDYRVNFIFGAVAAIAYGHARWNPTGPDSNWCVKDAGGGRPPSDDVIVKCRSRDAWDLISGAGADGYSFHRDYLGILPSVQNVYEPGRSALNFLPR